MYFVFVIFIWVLFVSLAYRYYWRRRGNEHKKNVEISLSLVHRDSRVFIKLFYSCWVCGFSIVLGEIRYVYSMDLFRRIQFSSWFLYFLITYSQFMRFSLFFWFSVDISGRIWYHFQEIAFILCHFHAWFGFRSSFSSVFFFVWFLLLVIVAAASDFWKLFHFLITFAFAFGMRTIIVARGFFSHCFFVSFFILATRQTEKYYV